MANICKVAYFFLECIGFKEKGYEHLKQLFVRIILLGQVVFDYIFPKKYITIREPYSEARRQAARERALNGHFQPPPRDSNP